LQSLLDRHQGRVVFVDFWATWCGPCVEQLPHTLELARAHRDEGLAVITVSMDEPEDEAQVTRFLQKQRAECDNLIGKYGAGTEFADAFAIPGDVPFYKLYDRQGKLRYQFSADPDGIEFGEPLSRIDERINQLLAETP
jgi:thiol-disulfide isomerase/thioredoxin